MLINHRGTDTNAVYDESCGDSLENGESKALGAMDSGDMSKEGILSPVSLIE